MHIIKFSELEKTPWKNGGGITREVAALRENAGVTWRLSIADVASDGPFSVFTGLTRILTVIQGRGIALQTGDIRIEAVLGLPVTFDGGQAVASKLIDGPIRDLNVMFDPARCHAEVSRVSAPAHLAVKAKARETVAVVGLEGETLVDRKQRLHVGDTVLMDAGEIALDLAGKSSALIVTISMPN